MTIGGDGQPGRALRVPSRTGMESDAALVKAQRRAAAVRAATEAYEDLAAIEPALRASIAPGEVGRMRYATGQAAGLRFAAWKQLVQSLDRLYERMIFLPGLQSGAAAAIARDAIRAVQLRHGIETTLVVVTERPWLPIARRLPEGTHVRVLPAGLRLKRRVEIVTALIYHLQPRAALNIGSKPLSRAIAEQGAALARVAELYAFVGPQPWVGRLPARRFRELRASLPHLQRIYARDPAVACRLAPDEETRVQLQQRLLLLPMPAPGRPRDSWEGFVRSFSQAPSFLG
jgi:hypothetical protein